MQTARTMNTNTNTHTVPWSHHTHFAALDWASDHHDVAIVDPTGALTAEFRFAHTAAGWDEFTDKMKPYAGAPLSLETSSGPAVDQLLQRGWTLYPVNPKAAERYRERKVPSGTKTDRHDAWTLADALRTDGQGWRKLLPQDEATATLSALCRDEMGLIEQRTALVNQLIACLREYYPCALELFDDWTQPVAWSLVREFPTPHRLQKAGKRRWEKFLHAHRLWRGDTAPVRMEIFARANALAASAAVVTAKSLLAATLVKLLQTLEDQLDAYRQRIDEVFTAHPDHDLFGSLPGAGEKLAPRLLGELGAVREEHPGAEGLCCLAGVSPVSVQSGKLDKARIRWACEGTFRHTMHLWADCSRKQSPWAQAYYKQKRAEGQGHASALRCLGKRWLKILWRLWTDRKPYDEARHLENQKKHGSWVSALLAAAPTEPAAV